MKNQWYKNPDLTHICKKNKLSDKFWVSLWTKNFFSKKLLIKECETVTKCNQKE